MKDKNVDLWSLDEVHFQQYGSICRMWVPPEAKDPVVKHNPTRKSVGYFGAVRLKDGKLVYEKELEKFNGESFLKFMKKLKKISSRTGKRVVVVIDNARYHHAILHKDWRQSVNKEFKLLFLPPYSPDLNPIERVWKLVRRLCIHNVYFESLEDVVDVIESKFYEWRLRSQALKSLCAV